MKRRILIVTNHSYMFWRFRRELVEELQKEEEVILVMPFVGHEEDFQRMGIRCIPVSMDRRGKNPFAEWKLFGEYKRLLEQEQPELVVTYSIKPNIYLGLLCEKKQIPCCANVQGLGSAFENPLLAALVTILYRARVPQDCPRFFLKTKRTPVHSVRRKLSRRSRRPCFPVPA